MFGMLDYRAHKLLWLLSLPIALGGIALSYALVVASALLSISYFDNFFLQLAAAVVGMEAAILALQLLLSLLTWGFRKLFRFFIDVVPSEGRDKFQAAEVLYGGPIVRLVHKLNNSPTEFDWDDELELTSRMKRSQGLIVRALRLLSGVGPDTMFKSTMEQRISEIVRVATEESVETEGTVPLTQADFDRILISADLAASRSEQFLVNYRHVIYKYVVLLATFFGAHALN